MKLTNLIILFLISVFTITDAAGQANAGINILTQNSGIVNTGGTVLLQVTINSTGPSASIGANKIDVTITVPIAIASLPASGHTLPSGWSIIGNDGETMDLCNGSDVIASGSSRTILIAVKGTNIGGPSTVAGQLSFSSGAGCAAPGSLAGDNPSDNSSQSSIQVTTPTPVTLTNFNAALVNCQPILNWTTETEINSSRYEIEKTNKTSVDWAVVGTVAAHGNSSAKIKYNFTDNNIAASTEKVLYRLKMIDKDGHYKYSDVLPVYINCKTTQVYVYPNPVQKAGSLYVSLTGINGHTEVALISLSGQVVLKTILKNGTTPIDVSNIANGTYILSAGQEEGISKKIKVVIQH